jgi:hypothetical protein
MLVRAMPGTDSMALLDVVFHMTACQGIVVGETGPSRKAGGRGNVLGPSGGVTEAAPVRNGEYLVQRFLLQLSKLVTGRRLATGRTERAANGPYAASGKLCVSVLKFSLCEHVACAFHVSALIPMLGGSAVLYAQNQFLTNQTLFF